ncbi:MAG: PA0069 family radical SAM protein [Saprospiraceae bacterium]|nr:PA0069 family radical SAM protein [Saprospiraceae bacterium]
MLTLQTSIKGRGAQINPTGRYEQVDRGSIVSDPEASTTYLPVHSKTLVNAVDSPDIPFGFSMNPYQGCEHGCIYCYARNTHPYWGYGAGLDFERKIMVKVDSPRLLEEMFRKPGWKASPIVLSGNTDCYQPAEQKYRLTRQILELCLRYRHPVSIITKNALIERDVDILAALAKYNLVHVAFSVTTLDPKLQQLIEPRTSSPAKKLNAISSLTRAGVPVIVMIAPIIPSINDNEIIPIARAVAQAGALTMQHMVIRLNGDIPELFTNWLEHHFPDRKERVLNGIRSLHGGKLGEARFRHRMRGAGSLAGIIAQQAKMARKKFGLEHILPPLNTSIHAYYKDAQLDLFAHSA